MDLAITEAFVTREWQRYPYKHLKGYPPGRHVDVVVARTVDGRSFVLPAIKQVPDEDGVLVPVASYHDAAAVCANVQRKGVIRPEYWVEVGEG